jgi:FkbM family methyltransferase
VIELLVAASFVSLPRLAPVLERFSQLGKLIWLGEDSSTVASNLPAAPRVAGVAELEAGSRLILLVAPPAEEIVDEDGHVLRVIERHSIAVAGSEAALIVDDFAQLELLAEIHNYPGFRQLLQCRGWTASDFRSAVLDRYGTAIEALRTQRRAAIFGAQRLGEEVVESLRASGIVPIAFVDNSPGKQGLSISGLPVLSLSEISDKSIPFVIATTRFASSITRQLAHEGFFHILPYSVMSLVDEPRYPDEIPYVGIQQDFAEHWARYFGLFLALSDDKSRDVLDGLIHYRLSYDSLMADAVADEYARQYFDAELIEFDGADVFVDLGGYDGDTAEKFIQYSGGFYTKIYVFEPDKNLLRRAVGRLQAYKAVEFVPAGAYSRDGELRFAASGRTNGAISDVGELVIPVRKLDSTISEAPSLIKMDIEGAETEALLGAANLLRTFRPKLAIAAYHYAPDLWRLVEVVREINPTYRFYLRHYSETGLESVIYAV